MILHNFCNPLYIKSVHSFVFISSSKFHNLGMALSKVYEYIYVRNPVYLYLQLYLGILEMEKGSIESSVETFSTLKITLQIKTANHFDYIVEDRNDLQTDNKFLDKLPFSLY